MSQIGKFTTAEFSLCSLQQWKCSSWKQSLQCKKWGQCNRSTQLNFNFMVYRNKLLPCWLQMQWI